MKIEELYQFYQTDLVEKAITTVKSLEEGP